MEAGTQPKRRYLGVTMATLVTSKAPSTDQYRAVAAAMATPPYMNLHPQKSRCLGLLTPLPPHTPASAPAPAPEVVKAQTVPPSHSMARLRLEQHRPGWWGGACSGNRRPPRPPLPNHHARLSHRGGRPRHLPSLASQRLGARSGRCLPPHPPRQLRTVPIGAQIEGRSPSGACSGTKYRTLTTTLSTF